MRLREDQALNTRAPWPICIVERGRFAHVSSWHFCNGGVGMVIFERLETYSVPIVKISPSQIHVNLPTA